MRLPDSLSPFQMGGFAVRSGLLLLMLFLSTPLHAQEQIEPAPFKPVGPELQELVDESAIDYQTTSSIAMSAAAVAKWVAVEKGTDASGVVSLLNEYGWDSEVVSAAVVAGDKYDVFTSVTRPGVKDFLLVPQNAMGAIEFHGGSPVPGYAATPASWSKEQIREEILMGMQAAIDALCSMKARPTEISAKVSAAGVVEIEAKWTASEVCGPR